MNLKLIWALPMALLSITNAAAQSNVGLVAHWPFNGNANDSTANGHIGTANNTTSGAGITGAANTAFYFNGSNSYVSGPYQSDLNISSYSLCAIIKPMGYYTGLCQGNDIICRGTQGYSGSYELSFTDNPYDNNDCFAQDTSKNVFVLPTATLTSTGTTTTGSIHPA